MIDWDGVTNEAVELLRQYLRLDTSNPPGNEHLATAFLADILRREGIEFESAEAAPGRDNLFARLGEGAGGICLLNHTDVVPVERQFWEREPFSGDLVDGMIWGRGALDMKGMGIIELMVFLLLKRERVALRRPVSFLAVADEEAGSEFGAQWVADNRPRWMDTDFVINEGAYGLAIPDGPQIFQVAPTEKVPFWVRLTVRGTPGHGSVPHNDNCAEHLVHALERITRWQRELRMLPIMREHVEAMARAGVLQAPKDVEASTLAELSPALKARLTNTVTVTTINTGIKANVIPAEAAATLDCRLLPDVDPDAFLDELREVVSDDRVNLEVFNRSMGAESTMDHEFVQVLSDVIAELAEGSHLVPEMTSGFTDSRIYRLRGIPAYGFVPCLVPPRELGGIHGHNERISVENLRLGIEVLYEIVRRLAA